MHWTEIATDDDSRAEFEKTLWNATLSKSRSELPFI